MNTPLGLHLVIPSCLGVGEDFSLKLRVLGPVYAVTSKGAFNTRKPGLGSPFNLNVERQIQYMDNCLPEWQGTLRVEEDQALTGPRELLFDGQDQGAFPGDKRPIKVIDGFAWQTPGFHFIRLRDPVSGVEACSNPCYVTETKPALRLVWGDPHWQTFFTDGVRCPEELYHFARNEAFLDFGAISDHMEGVTDRQWDYFQAVSNDCNEPGRFVTLLGQEWTHHDAKHGAPGHRNIYYRDSAGPPLRSHDPDCNTLDKLWARLDAFDGTAIAIPHHSANVVMGVDWNQGWNATYEKAVEIYSVWGSSEKPASAGNTRPIQSLEGEKDGRHVRDALARGFRFGFVGGGDVHDGRPGLAMHAESYPPRGFEPYPQGYTAAWVPELTREHVFDAMANRQTYATTQSRVFLQVEAPGRDGLAIRTASEDGLARVVLVCGDTEADLALPTTDARCAELSAPIASWADDEYFYVRVETQGGEMAWSTPLWGDAL